MGRWRMLIAIDKGSTVRGSELALMKRVAQGDPRAQRVLAHRLSPRVQRLARRLLNNATDAEDAAQNSLLEILRSAGGYAEQSSIERWADRITVRTSLRLAREQRKPWLLGSLIDVEGLASIGRRGVAEQTPRPIESYLAELKDGRREVLVMKHALGYTTEEIAEALELPVGTIKDRLVTARKQLRKVISREMRIGARDEDGPS